MWYEAYNGIGDQVRIGHATSPHPDSSWKKDPNNPVTKPTIGTWDAGVLPTWGIDPWGIIKVGPTYYQWYNTVGAICDDLDIDKWWEEED